MAGRDRSGDRGCPRLVALVAAALLFAACAPRLSTPEPSCACTHGPTGQGTPWPVSPADALVVAGRAVDAVDAASMAPFDVAGRRIYGYDDVARTSHVFVDGDAARLLEVVLVPALPIGPSTTVGAAAARAAAERYVARLGLGSAGGAPAVVVARGADVAWYRVEWAATSGPGGRALSVDVEAVRGEPFALLDRSSGIELAAPTVGRAAAERTALGTLSDPSEQVLSAELRPTFDAGRQGWTWQIGLGVPLADQPGVYARGGVVDVDAVSGTATVVKRG